MSGISKVVFEYQTIVVGLIGFAGVIATLFANAKIARNQRQSDLLHERNAIRQGLLTELNALRSTYLDRAETGGGEKDWLIPVSVSDNFYQAMLSQIGKLSFNEIGPVMKAYQLASEMPTRLLILSPVSLKDQPRHGYIHIKREHVEHVKEMHLVFVKEFDNGIKILTEMLEQEHK